MGTTTATLYVKPRASGYLSVNGQTEAHLFIPIRAVSGAYEGFGITTARNLRGLKSLLPSAQVPIGFAMVGGQRVPVQIDETYWYAFLNHLVNVFLDLNSNVTMADIKRTVVADQALALATQALGAVLLQQVSNNAQVLVTAVETIRSAELPGATQIPQVQITPYEPAYEYGSTGGGDGGGGGGDGGGSSE